jgi:hypothetical protein
VVLLGVLATVVSHLDATAVPEEVQEALKDEASREVEPLFSSEDFGVQVERPKEEALLMPDSTDPAASSPSALTVPSENIKAEAQTESAKQTAGLGAKQKSQKQNKKKHKNAIDQLFSKIS